MFRMNFRGVLHPILLTAGFLVPIMLFIVDRKVAELSFGLVSESQLLPLSDSEIKDIAVLYQGIPVDSLTAMTYRLENSGSVPIHANDFEREIRLLFPGRVQLLSFSVSESRPENLRPEVLQDGIAGLKVSPLLLNPGDRFSLNVYLSGQPSEVELDARVAGVSTVTRLEPLIGQRRWLRAGFVIMTGIALYLSYFYIAGSFSIVQPVSHVTRWQVLGLLPLVAIGGILLVLHGASLLEIGDRSSLVLGGLMIPGIGILIGTMMRRSRDQAATQPSATSPHD